MLSPYLNEINNNRVVFMFETAPLSNRYEQITLTKEQYTKVLNLLESFMPHKPDGGFIVKTVGNTIILPAEIVPYMLE